MATQAAKQSRSAPIVAFGVVLFVAWGVEAIIWIASTVDSAVSGSGTSIIRAVAWLALLALLAGMEGLEVSVIDRWRVIYPERPTSQLAAWLAARQLFVALIVTTATLLAKLTTLYIPVASTRITTGIVISLFTLTWTGFTVLWFAQIFPKHLAATNPDRYLRHLRALLFPVVEVVRRIGISRPGEMVASAVERQLAWEPTAAEVPEALPPEQSLGSIWRTLIPEDHAELRDRGPEELAQSAGARESFE